MPNGREDDPHAGLADLEPELDIQGMLAGGEGDRTPSSLAAAAATLRTGSDDPATLLDDDADAAADDEAGDDAILDEPGDAEPDEAEQADAEEETDEDAEAEEEDGAQPKTFTLTVPVLGRPGDDEQTLVLEGLPQEFHDQLKGHLKRSAELDAVRDRLQVAEQYQTASEFVTQQPLAAMLMLDQQDRQSKATKQVGERFTKLWMQQNPEAALKLIRDLKYDDPDRLDPEILKERAEAAALRVEKAVNKGLAQQSGQTRTAQWTSSVRDLLRGAAAELSLDAEAQEDFMQLAIGNIGRESKRQQALGRDPLLDQTAVVQQIQRAVQRFAAAAPKGGRPPANDRKAGAATDTKDKFERRHRTQQRARKLGPGKATIPSVGAVVSLKKLKGAHGVKEAAAVLRES